jgi:hypothetical protein
MGWICEQWGPRTGLLISGVAAAAVAAALLPALRRIHRRNAVPGEFPTARSAEQPAEAAP